MNKPKRFTVTRKLGVLTLNGDEVPSPNAVSRLCSAIVTELNRPEYAAGARLVVTLAPLISKERDL